jgi:DNA-binding NtrC family response regulator
MANLLLVDDAGDLVGALADQLRSEGHEVRTANNGEEGLIALRTPPLPEAVVLDVDMPILGGPGMAHQMLLHDAGQEMVPIILVSGRNDLAEIAKKMGTSYFLRKPCDLITFLGLLDRALHERTPPASA